LVNFSSRQSAGLSLGRISRNLEKSLLGGLISGPSQFLYSRVLLVENSGLPDVGQDSAEVQRPSANRNTIAVQSISASSWVRPLTTKPLTGFQAPVFSANRRSMKTVRTLSCGVPAASLVPTVFWAFMLVRDRLAPDNRSVNRLHGSGGGERRDSLLHVPSRSCGVPDV